MGYVGVSLHTYLITVITRISQISTDNHFSRVFSVYLYIYSHYVIKYIGGSVGNTVEDYRVTIEYGCSAGYTIVTGSQTHIPYALRNERE